MFIANFPSSLILRRTMFKLSLFMLFAFYVHNSSCIVDDLYEAGKLVWDLYLIVDKMHAEDPTHSVKLKDIFTDGKLMNPKIKFQMEEIFKKFNGIEKFMNSKKINDPSQMNSSVIRLYMIVERLEGVVENIDYNYQEFEKYMQGEYYNSEEALKELLQNIFVDAEGDITWIRKVIIGEGTTHLKDTNLIQYILANEFEGRDEKCDRSQLTGSIVAQIFRMVVIAEIKANFVLFIAYIYQYGDKYDGWNEMILSFQKQLRVNFASYVTVFAERMNAIDILYLRACDPSNNTWIRDQNFYELEKTFQTTIIQYNWRKSSGGCKTIRRPLGIQGIPSEYSNRTGCSEVGQNCIDLGEFEACVLKNGPHRFQYVNSTIWGRLGTNFDCPKDNGYPFEVGDNWRSVYKACVCDCFEGHGKISSSLLKSRVSSNWVITGLRFFRQNGILHIQPREGKLETSGYISPDNEEWVPIPDDPQIYTIHRMNKVFFLDDLRLPPFYALTGVQFIEETRGNITGFAIQIFGIKFDYKSGTCLSEKEFGMSIKGSNIIAGSDISFRRIPPTYEWKNNAYPEAHYTPNLGDFQYVSLEKSELAIDFGQSTLPFFHAVPIITSPPSLLGGIGMFYKGADGYSGFISLRVFGIKYKEYFSNFQLKTVADGHVFFYLRELD